MKRFLGSQDRGATAIEYSLLVGIVAIVIIVSVGSVGTTLNTFYSDVAVAIGTPVPAR